MKNLFSPIPFIIIICLMSCRSSDHTAKKATKQVRLITLDPGHFHAALVQKAMYDDVDSVVQVYAPEGEDLKLHLDKINAYNSRTENPTHWKEEAYTGNDFFEKMLNEKKGNVVVLAGNNEKKTGYILQSLEAGFNVLADKPMVITPGDFVLLKKAFDIAKEKNLLLYDIMTERFEMPTILQRELSMMPEIFGTLEKGTPENPAVIMESGHCFFKNVSGKLLTRPAWFFDVNQQGEGIVDVTTHLVDLVQWECFPELSLDYSKDIVITNAKRWPTNLSSTQFNKITKLNSFPDFLKKNITNDTLLSVYSNGEINYQVRGVNARIKVQWDYTTEAAVDTHYSLLRGTKANLIIRQGKEENYKPVLFIKPVNKNMEYEKKLNEAFKKVSAKFPGVELYKTGNTWRVNLPDKLREGHEQHFARVMENYLQFLTMKNMPAWEVPGMLAKYYTTTRALEYALKNK